MTLKIDKELFQWEKERYVFVEGIEEYPGVSVIQFFNKKSECGPEVPIENNKAKIPNYLLKDCLPITALACTKVFNGTQVVCRKVFKVLGRVKPEYYIEDEDTSKDIIYDGGIEV